MIHQLHLHERCAELFGKTRPWLWGGVEGCRNPNPVTLTLKPELSPSVSVGESCGFGAWKMGNGDPSLVGTSVDLFCGPILCLSFVGD